MPTVTIDGIKTNYDVIGKGEPLLMYAPGGFDASMDKWSNLGIYAKIKLLDHLPEHFSCIVFDRRETGKSGGRVERITWDDYVTQGVGLLDHLGYEKAHLIGGCMGVCPVLRFATTHPERVNKIIPFWPVGGAGFRLNANRRFSIHYAYVEEHGLEGAVKLAQSITDGFGKDPRQGPWGPVLRSDPEFAKQFAKQNQAHYLLTVAGLARTLIDRDSVPGAEPEDLMQLDTEALIIPGRDKAHATSAARFVEECLPNAEYWDSTPDEQTEEAVAPRIIDFLKR